MHAVKVKIFLLPLAGESREELAFIMSINCRDSFVAALIECLKCKWREQFSSLLDTYSLE